jgi:hypothetical protein
MPFTVAWNLATALEPIQNAKHLVLEVLERTVALAPSPFTASFDENSPVAQYLRVSKQLNQGQRAIAWLRKQAAIQQISQWQPQTYDPIRLECALSLADRMNDLERQKGGRKTKRWQEPFMNFWHHFRIF